MSIQRIQQAEVGTIATRVLGLDETVDLFSLEGLCASLRRAASFLCPASPGQVVDALLDTLAPISPDLTRTDIADALDLLIGIGDLLELRSPPAPTRLLYLAPPSYVEREPGQYLLLGVRPNAEPIVDEDLIGTSVLYEAHIRSVSLDPNLAAEVFNSAGLHRLTREQWTKAPRHETSAAVISKVRNRLATSPTTGQVIGLLVIDPTTSVRYYKGRWREPTSTDRGIFVGRRPQAYGAPIWCVVELIEGTLKALIDLPADSTTAPGWDEARRLQAAVDAERGTSQVFRIQPSENIEGAWILDFFGPLPSWADRYLEVTGFPAPRSKGALYSYRVSDGVVGAVSDFLSKSLWMNAIEEV